MVDVEHLVEVARQAHRDWWEADDDAIEEVRALVDLHDLSKATLKSPEVDESAAEHAIAAGLALFESDEPVDRIFGLRLVREMDIRRKPIAIAILDLLRREQNPDVVHACISGLYFVGYVEAIPELIGFIEDPDSDLRYTLAGAISSCSADRFSPGDDDQQSEMPESALVALLQLTVDEDVEVRFSALFEFSSWWQHEGLRDSRVERVLRAGLSDDDEGIRFTCAEALEPAKDAS